MIDGEAGDYGELLADFVPNKQVCEDIIVKDGSSRGENFVMRSSELNCRILGREPISSVDVYLSRKSFSAKSTEQ